MEGHRCEDCGLLVVGFCPLCEDLELCASTKPMQLLSVNDVQAILRSHFADLDDDNAILAFMDEEEPEERDSGDWKSRSYSAWKA